MYILKLVTLASFIIKFPGFRNIKISNNHKLFSPFLGEKLSPIKLLNLTWGRDYLAGHCFVLRGLIRINIFKEFKIYI